jgi:hypothetical protein
MLIRAVWNVSGIVSYANIFILFTEVTHNQVPSASRQERKREGIQGCVALLNATTKIE